jgi:hypothetical protein
MHLRHMIAEVNCVFESLNVCPSCGCRSGPLDVESSLPDYGDEARSEKSSADKTAADGSGSSRYSFKKQQQQQQQQGSE